MVDPRTTLLINPVAGNAEGAGLIDALRRSPEVAATSAAIVELSLENFDDQVQVSRRSDHVVVGGGDGTISRVIGELDGYKGVVGLLPLGTANDLARELGMPVVTPGTAVAALEGLLTLPPRPVDVWELEWERADGVRTAKRFVNYCSWGYDAAVLDDVDQWRKGDIPTEFRNRLITRGAYLGFGIERLFKGQSLSAEVVGSDGVVHRLERLASLLIANVRSYMGIAESNRAGDIGDGRAEIVPVRSVLDLAGMLLPFRRGDPPFSVEGGTVRFFTPPKFCQLDGERIEIGAAQEFNLRRAYGLKVPDSRLVGDASPRLESGLEGSPNR